MIVISNKSALYNLTVALGKRKINSRLLSCYTSENDVNFFHFIWLIFLLSIQVGQ
jgi:hypothetical protein